MNCRVGMIADDLTGALDAAAPFAERGLETLVLVGPEAMGNADHAAIGRAEVICINTASREIGATEAEARVAAAAALLMRFGPSLVFKKIDSRLKGHVAIETTAMLAQTGRQTAVVAPAIPDLGRIVVSGAVSGRGVEKPIPVASAFGEIAIECPDTPDAASLAEVARTIIDSAGSRLPVGARGLAQALAARLAPGLPRSVELPLRRPLLVAIGSRDPITREQVDLVTERLSPQRILAPNGSFAPAAEQSDVCLVTAETGDTEQDSVAVAQRFAGDLARHIADTRPASIVISGGETAFAVLRQLGVTMLRLFGEALPGVPYASATLAGREVVILTKSGGFGNPDTLYLLLESSLPIN